MAEAIYYDIELPERTERLSNKDILCRPSISAQDYLKIIDEDKYEDIIAEWAIGYAKNNYEQVKGLGGKGDKGRDICAYVDLKKNKFHLYQCKHYDHKLTFSDVVVEFGKLLYYTFNKDYPVPEKYYFVAPQGVSTQLWDYITDKREDLREKIIEVWSKNIESHITSTKKIKLEPPLLDYIQKFNFDIFYSLEPLDFINQFQTTSFYASRFGGGLQKPRNMNVKPSDNIEHREINYVNQLFKAYSDHKKEKYNSVEEVNNTEFKDHFNRSRACFYLAETLEQFSRDNIPADCNAFEELKEEVYEQVIDTCNCEHESGYKRVIATTDTAKQVEYRSSLLYSAIKQQDKTGICHHLANENRLIWVKE